MLRYSAALRQARCELLLAGVGKRVLDQLERTGALAELGPDDVFLATARVGQSLTSALEQARAAQLTAQRCRLAAGASESPSARPDALTLRG